MGCDIILRHFSACRYRKSRIFFQKVLVHLLIVFLTTVLGLACSNTLHDRMLLRLLSYLLLLSKKKRKQHRSTIPLLNISYFLSVLCFAGLPFCVFWVLIDSLLHSLVGFKHIIFYTVESSAYDVI